MAPEIKKRETHDGRKADLFSAAVVLFTLVRGIFPFQQACKSDSFYTLIMVGQIETYWSHVGGESLSAEFKDLFIKMVDEDPEKRPSI